MYFSQHVAVIIRRLGQSGGEDQYHAQSLTRKEFERARLELEKLKSKCKNNTVHKLKDLTTPNHTGQGFQINVGAWSRPQAKGTASPSTLSMLTRAQTYMRKFWKYQVLKLLNWKHLVEFCKCEFGTGHHTTLYPNRNNTFNGRPGQTLQGNLS